VGELIFRRPFFWLIVMVTAVFALVPLRGNNVNLRESLLLAAVSIILASNVNLMIGYTGYVNFGNIVFYGLGGYLGIYLSTSLGWRLVPAALAAGVGVSLFALAFGAAILRLRGAYFALATIGVNEAVKAFVSNFRPWGKAEGIYLEFSAYKPLGGPMRALWVIYFLVIAVMAASLLVSYAVKNSKFGLGLFAIREDEDAATVLGVRAPRFKTIIFSLSAFLPAVAGALVYFKSGMIDPGQAFDLTLSIEAIVMMMLGGQGTVTGAAVGAFLYEQLRGFLLTQPRLSSFHLVIAGALLLVIVLFAPGGLMGAAYRRFPRLRTVLD
jgi:branched-chain amino acid transport system permease protein